MWNAALVVSKHLNVKRTCLCRLFCLKLSAKLGVNSRPVAVRSPPSTSALLHWARPGQWARSAFSATSSSYLSGLACFSQPVTQHWQSENTSQLPFRKPVVYFPILTKKWMVFTTRLNQLTADVSVHLLIKCRNVQKYFLLLVADCPLVSHNTFIDL